ncbi:MAG: hypothetical protein ABIJ61_11705 [bacterium]
MTRIVAGLLSLLFIFLIGCSHSINYNLTESQIAESTETAPISVGVIALIDARDSWERSKKKCKNEGMDDCGDYTQDKDFGNHVAADISTMLVSHLEYSRAFENVSLLDAADETLGQDELQRWAGSGVDAVLTGRIEHFYGYYNGGSKVLPVGLCLASAVAVGLMTIEEETYEFSSPYGGGGGMSTPKVNTVATTLGASAGWLAGAYLESLSARDNARQTRLSLALISTASGDTLWSGVASSEDLSKSAMPGLNTDNRKYQLAVRSLREAINNLVEQMDKLDRAELARAASRTNLTEASDN